MPILAKEFKPIPTKDILSWIFDESSLDPEKPVYIDAGDPTKSFNRRQAKLFIRRLIAGLHASGLQKGDCVCIHSFNQLHYPLLVLSIIGAGGVFSGTNPAYTPFELSRHMTLTKARFVFAESDILQPILEAVKKVDNPPSKIFTFDEHDQQTGALPSWKSLLEVGERDWIRFDDYETCASTLAMLPSTSGTTGLPKPAMISHYNLIAQHTLVWERVQPPYEFKTMVALPMFHAAIAPLTHTSALRAGYSLYIMRRFELDSFWSGVAKFRVTDLLIVPPIVVRTIMSDVKEKYDLKCVKRLFIGAAPLDPDAQQKIGDIIGGTTNQVYGMTESTCIITFWDDAGEQGRPGEVGRLIPNLDLKLISDDGTDITAPGVNGEICVRGPLVSRGYFNNPEANKHAFDSEGYYHSGDVGYMEKDTGCFHIVDRKKELIKVRAFQVAPNEIEGVLLKHPAVADAAVIGLTVPWNLEAELPRAYIVLKPGQTATEDEIIEYAGSRLARYKRLEGGVKFVNEIPKNATGKILKRILRETAAKEIKQTGSKL